MLDNVSTCLKVSWKPIFGVLWPIVLLPVPLLSGSSESKCGYVLLLMAGYFTFEPIPLAATALIPVFLFPLLGIMGTTRTCYQYMKDTIMMYLGGLLFAAAVEHSNLHKRIALKVLLSIGTSPRWILLGFSLTTMFLSMWITNTATTAMMVPIVEAVVSELRHEFLQRELLRKTKRLSYPHTVSASSFIDMGSLEKKKSTVCSITTIHGLQEEIKDPFHKIEDPEVRKMLFSLQTALLLTLAFAANFGGTGTLIGSGPNLVLKSQMEELFPDYKGLTFSTWMMYNVPGMLIGTFLLWMLFQVLYVPCCKKSTDNSKNNKELVERVIRKNYEELGPISFHEVAVLSLFTLLVIAWLMREPQFTTGWADVFVYGSNIKDATAAVGMSLFLFLIPARPWHLASSQQPLLQWRVAQAKVPWGVLLLLGGGIALAEGAKESGLSYWISEELADLQSLRPEVIAVVLCLLAAGLTEFVSNMSMATILLPVVSQMALATKVNPLLYMLPVTIACSYAFMLPVGNPSNAIIFDSGSMSIMQMVKPGILVKLIACAIELVMIQTIGVSMFDLNNFPTWANNSLSFVQPEISEALINATVSNMTWTFLTS